MITRAEAVALTELLRTIRPAWDALTTINVLCALAARDLADIAHAAIRTAQDSAMRTPQSLAFTDSPHWRPTLREQTTQRAVPLWEDTARLQEIANCDYCDDRGYIAARGPDGTEYSRYPCIHEDPEELKVRAHTRAAAARAAIRPPSNRARS